MLLDKFFIKVKKQNSEKEFEIIRQVNFVEGLNIISDKTINPKKSGNNVGKTTFIKLIKFCLGGNKDIFKDRELKIENKDLKEKIKDYFFELIIKTNESSITLRRDFKSNNYINGVLKRDIEYDLELRKILFNMDEESKKPSLGELLVKFVKVDIEQINNLLKINHSTTTNPQYEAMWLLLFGYKHIEDLTKKSVIINDVKKIKTNDSALSSLEQKLPLLEAKLVDLKHKRDGIKIKEYVVEKIEDISTVRDSINYLKEEISYLSIEIKDYEKQKLLIGKTTDIQSSQIEDIYKSVGIDLPNLSNNFNKIIIFYNTMLKNKLSYINDKISELNDRNKKKKEELDLQLDKEKQFLLYLKSKEDFGEYENINNDILEVSKNIEATETRISIFKEATDAYNGLNDSMKEIEKSFISFNEEYTNNLKQFNKYFSEYTDKVYQSKYYISIDKKDNKHFKDAKEYLLTIDGLDSTPSAGNKRSLIYLFDLAYLNFSIENNLKVPYFFLHDQLESIYYTNIEKMFEITENTKGQCIVALLSDKIKDFGRPIKPILELSQEDKLFRI